MNQAPEQQPRIPGVAYKKVTRYWTETTDLDGKTSTREVPYEAWVPKPPRDWDALILRGVTTVAISFTVIAVVATAASVGGLLSKMVPGVVAYGMGAVFTLAWLYCLAIEWLNRISPERAVHAKVGGWIALLISMGAVYAYGHTLGQDYAGAFGACIDLLAKGSWWLLLRQHAVPLSARVAHWVVDQEQKVAGRSLLRSRIARLNANDAYERAVGGAEYQAADAILASVETAPAALAPQPPAAPPVDPAATAPVPPASVPSVSPAAEEQQPPVPPVAPIDRPQIAAICRQEIGANPKASDADLVEAVKKAGHPDRPNLFDTVRRTARRIDPSRKAS
ncbi:hypothetical protein ACFVSQ_10345 [Streptomyces niveus]|uniref:hypothetical protein n=1 Tax=Streptomyces niveus TaxID=193462 RepID=UPI0036E194F0